MNQTKFPSIWKSTGLAPMSASARICHCLKVIPSVWSWTIRSLEGIKNQTVPSGIGVIRTPLTAWEFSVVSVLPEATVVGLVWAESLQAPDTARRQRKDENLRRRRDI